MGEITRVIETAVSFVGFKEGSSKYNELIKAYNSAADSKTQYDGQGCTEGVIGAFVLALGRDRAKKLVPVVNYANGQAKKWPLADKPKIGCIAYYGGSDIDHEELVIDIRGSKLTTIDFNFNHEVIKRTRYTTDRQSKGYGCPKYNLDRSVLLSTWTSAVIRSVSLKKGDTGELVLWLQEFLHTEGFYNGYFDGVFGDVLDSAVRAYQKEHGLLVDGICAKYFWSEVLL